MIEFAGISARLYKICTRICQQFSVVLERDQGYPWMGVTRSRLPSQAGVVEKERRVYHRAQIFVGFRAEQAESRQVQSPCQHRL